MNGQVVKALDYRSRVWGLITTESASKFNLAFHPSEVDQTSTKNSWGHSD